MHEDETRYLRPEDARQHEEAVLKYRNLAVRYDISMARTQRWRERAVAALGLEAGQTVVEVGCGTGGNFELILEGIGPEGRLIGVDVSREMLSVAQARLSSTGAENVELLEEGAETVRLPHAPERALCSFTHDVLQSPRAVDNVCGQLRPTALVSAVGSKRPSYWNLPLNGLVRLIASRYVTSFRNFARPWHELERHADLEIEEFALGAIYVAHGPLRAQA